MRGTVMVDKELIDVLRQVIREEVCWRLDSVESRFDRLETEFARFRLEIRMRLDSLAETVRDLDRRVTALEIAVVKLDRRVTAIEERLGMSGAGVDR